MEFHKNPITSRHWIAEFKSPEIECEQWYDTQFYRYRNDLGGMNALIEKQTGKLLGHCGLLVQEVDGISGNWKLAIPLTEFWNKVLPQKPL